ncbi:MAG TPA: hypothetical protein VFC25_16300 [Verrucomicrobiae bacterium]|nr:hypothetical protein [Verrucomicrobiae bacterium]
MGRYAYIWYLAPAEGGETVNGGEHPKLDMYPGEKQFLGGFHLARIPLPGPPFLDGSTGSGRR